MKAWKKGAIVGGAIGLLRVMDFIFYPIIGAVIGAVLVQSIYTFVTTTKMKLWQKGGAIGAIYGFLASFIGMFLARASGSQEISVIFKAAYYLFLYLPTYTVLKFNFLFRYNDTYIALAQFMLWFLIGAIIGYVSKRRRD